MLSQECLVHPQTWLCWKCGWAGNVAVLLPGSPVCGALPSRVQELCRRPRRITPGTAGTGLGAAHKPCHTPADTFGVSGCLCLLPRTVGVRKASLAELPLHAEPGRAEHKTPLSTEHQNAQSRFPRISAGLRLALAGLSALA